MMQQDLHRWLKQQKESLPKRSAGMNLGCCKMQQSFFMCGYPEEKCRQKLSPVRLRITVQDSNNFLIFL